MSVVLKLFREIFPRKTDNTQPGIQIGLTHPALAEFRNCIHELVTRKDSLNQPIASITLVGAVFNGSTDEGSFSMRDRRWIELTLTELNKLGRSLAPHAKLICPNIAYDQRDFLDDRLRFETDVVVACFVLDPLSETTQEFLNQEKYPFLPSYSTSPYHRDDRSWPDAVHRVGAGLVITFSQNIGMEIAARNFSDPTFRKIDSKIVSAPHYTDFSSGLSIMPCARYIMDTLTVNRPKSVGHGQPVPAKDLTVP